MSDPLVITFEILANSSNNHAVEVLIPALDLDVPEIREKAIKSLISRKSTRGQVEIIRRFHSLPPDLQASLKADQRGIHTALKQCLLHGDKDLQQCGLEMVRQTKNFDQMSSLLAMLDDDRNQLQDLTAQSISHLVNTLYDQLNSRDGNSAPEVALRNPAQIKDKVLSEMGSALSKISGKAYATEVIQNILALGDPESASVKQALWQASPECREVAGSLLMTSQHPGVMQLVIDFMGTKYPHPTVFEAISKREDAEFISHLLRTFPKRLSQTQKKNYRQLEQINWIDANQLNLDLIPPNLQDALVAFTSSIGLAREEKIMVQEWLLCHGGPEGRSAATNVLGLIDEESAQKIVIGGLNSDDPDQQAWATHQLRSRGVPEAFSLLINGLDSSSESVQEASREELQSFNLDQLLETFEQLDAVTALKAGDLLQKIDSDCINKMRRELSSPIRRKRIRATRATLALGFHHQLVPSLLAMLEDSDSMVRRVGIEVLAHVDDQIVPSALKNMLEDSSPRVQDTANKALLEFQQRAARSLI